MYYSLSLQDQGYIEDALINYKNFHDIERELFNIKKNKELFRLQVKFDTENKVKQNRLLQKNIEDGTRKLSKQRLTLMLLIIIVVLTLILIFAMYSGYRIKHKVNIDLEKLVAERTEGLGLEIEKHKTTSKNLLAAKEKAEESDRLKSAFLANMSHEIRTPMNGIMGFSSLLLEPGLSGEKQQEYIGIIKKSGNRLMDTIHDLLSISMIESDQVKVNTTITDINEQTGKLYSFFKGNVEAKGIELVLKNSLLSDEAIIETDGEKVYNILSNLIKNAIKFTHNGTIEYGCKLINSDGKPGRIKFYVKDTGIGIAKNRQQVVFDRFVHAHIDGDMIYEGSGLGLSISKAYVEMLNGEIWMESEKGKGSVFYFTIPYYNDTRKITKKAIVEPGPKPEIRKSELKILIAEDDEFADLHMSILLENFGKEILHCKTGTLAVELCRENKDIDLVLMDIKMPEMDGFEAASTIRGFNKDVIIIAQTAYTLEADREKALIAGCNDYISKPIIKEDLLAIITKHI